MRSRVPHPIATQSAADAAVKDGGVTHECEQRHLRRSRHLYFSLLPYPGLRKLPMMLNSVGMIFISSQSIQLKTREVVDLEERIPLLLPRFVLDR
jgi:hypothetical protein